MLYFFFAFFFLFLEFPITVGTGVLNLMPACVGCVLLLLGIARLADGTHRFLRMRLSSAVLLLLSLVRTAMGVFGVGQGGVFPLVTQTAEMLLALHISYEVAEYVKAKEKAVSRPLGGKDLASAWFLLALGNLLSLLTGRVESVAFLCLVLQLLSILWYQMALWRAHKKISGIRK